MQRPSKLSAGSLLGPPTFSGPQGWADLPDGLLHSIVARLGSFRGLVGFAATCPSWRAAYSSYPSKSMFRTKFPPLLVQPHVRVQGPLLPSTDGSSELLTCKVIDPANLNTSLRCQIPRETLDKMTFIGSSYGNLIYYCDGYCRIVDVFTGMEVSTPPLIYSAKCRIRYLKGILAAPLASPNSHLLVSTKYSLLDLPVGSDSWSEVQLPPCMLKICQIVEFNGQFIVSDDLGRFYTVQLSHQFGLQEITTQFHDTIKHPPERGWLVVCGDMLLMHNASKLYRLDMSTKPATWMAVEKLDNWALFMGAGVKSTPHSCMSPELWEGRSNIVYSAHTFRPWALYGLCGMPDPMQDTPPIEPIVAKASVWPFWLYPSMFYSDGL